MDLHPCDKAAILWRSHRHALNEYERQTVLRVSMQNEDYTTDEEGIAVAQIWDRVKT